MTTPHHQIAERFVRLALASELHIEDLIDAYFGPGEWKHEAQTRGKQPLVDLIQEAQALIEVTASSNMPVERREHLLGELKALYTSLSLHNGERIALVDEARAIFDISPAWVSESSFEEAHKELDSLLPGDGTLGERLDAFRTAIEFPLEGKLPQFNQITNSLRNRTHSLFKLPEAERFELKLVHGQPWGAFNRYLGHFQSTIEISAERPGDPIRMAGLLAHEGYPGHHTELAIKEERLVNANGWVEFNLVLTQAPSALIAEGLAMHALYVLMPDDELLPWLDQEVFPLFSAEHFDARRALAIQRARHKLNGVSGNAAFMLLDQGMPDKEVAAYLQRYSFVDAESAHRSINFIRYARAYTFLYHLGADLLNPLLAEGNNPISWFVRLLSEPVTPQQVRAWITQAHGVVE